MGEGLREDVARRQGYATAIAEGLALPETEKSKNPAADGISTLWTAVERGLKRVATPRKPSAA
jgi:hypothetical protein